MNTGAGRRTRATCAQFVSGPNTLRTIVAWHGELTASPHSCSPRLLVTKAECSQTDKILGTASITYSARTAAWRPCLSRSAGSSPAARGPRLALASCCSRMRTRRCRRHSTSAWPTAAGASRLARQNGQNATGENTSRLGCGGAARPLIRPPQRRHGMGRSLPGNARRWSIAWPGTQTS